MAPSFFVRAQRAVVANLEIGFDGLERWSRGSVSRLSVRELDEAADDARRERFEAERRRDQARGEATTHSLAAADWQDKACYALDKDRHDLAAAAIERQIESEKLASAATQRADEAAADAERMAALGEQLAAERTRMVQELAALDREQTGSGPAPAGRSIEERAEQARTRFHRMMEDAQVRRPAPAAEPLGDLETLQRETEVARRLDALAQSRA